MSTSGAYLTQSGSVWYNRANYLINSNVDANNLYCGGNLDGSGIRTDMSTGTKTAPFPSTSGLYDKSFTPFWYDYNGDDETVSVDINTHETYYFSGTNVQNSNTTIVNSGSYYSYALYNDVLIYRLTNSILRLTDEISGTPTYTPPTNTTNSTYYVINETSNTTYNSLRSLELLRNDGVAIGNIDGSQSELLIIDYNGGSPTTLNTIDLDYDIFGTSSYNDRLFIGVDGTTLTSTGVIVYEDYDTTPSYIGQDGYPILKRDEIKAVININETTGYVCDQNDEVDYYTVGNSPSGNLAGGCYDLAIDNDRELLIVETGITGFNIYNISTPSTPSLIVNTDYTTSTHAEDYGDFIDYDYEIVLMRIDEITYGAFNTTDPELPIIITECNTGGAGVVNSLEMINQYTAVAGLSNGRIAICDLTNTDETTNTEWYSVDTMNSETIKGVEYDGTTLHMIGDTIYASVILSQEQVTTNNPPSIANFTISDYEAEIGQTVTITITPDDVEPSDIIRYGYKCNSNETSYQENLEGTYDCEYTTSGSKTIRIAVTDNYHIGTWYDVTDININVLPTIFTGGIIQLIVLDDLTSSYVSGAEVSADDQNTTTDSFGRATLTMSEEIAYLVTISKSGYQTKYTTVTADGNTNYIMLEPEAVSGSTNLEVTVLDNNGLPIEDSLVSYTNTLTYEYDYYYTDANGKVFFNDVDSGTAIVHASKQDYDTKSESVSITSGSTNTVTIYLESIGAFTGTISVDRNCIDEGIWLCGSSSVVEHSCTVDADCELSDYCVKGIDKCSRFNYSACDEIGMPRTQRCVMKLSGDSVLNNITNWMLSNLLWVIVMLIILVGAGMLFVAWKK